MDVDSHNKRERNYEGRSMNKLQNGAVSLILKISEVPNVRYVGKLFWNTLWKFVNNDDTVTSLSALRCGDCGQHGVRGVTTSTIQPGLAPSDYQAYAR